MDEQKKSMMSDINSVSLTGRVTNQPIIKQTKNGKFMAFMTLAVQESYKDFQTGERKEKAPAIPAIPETQQCVLCLM